MSLRHDFFGGELAVDHALDACDAVVVGDVDGADALGIAAERADVADPQVDRDALAGHNQKATTEEKEVNFRLLATHFIPYGYTQAQIQYNVNSAIKAVLIENTRMDAG